MEDQKDKQCIFIFYCQFWSFTRGTINFEHDCR